MAIWPLADSKENAEGGALTASSVGTTVTASATPHAKGAWVTMIAATTFEASEMQVYSDGATFVAATDTSALFEVAIGAAASEVVIVPEMGCGHIHTSAKFSVRYPVTVPAGSRISIRMQSAVASKTSTFAVRLSGGGVVPPEHSAASGDAYGILTASSGGTVMTIAGTINTKSAWVELVAATTRRARFLVVNIQPVAGTSIVSTTQLIDIGIGAGGSETVIIPNITCSTNNSEVLGYCPYTCAVNIPEGTRIAARYQAASITAGSNLRVSVLAFA